MWFVLVAEGRVLAEYFWQIMKQLIGKYSGTLVGTLKIISEQDMDISAFGIILQHNSNFDVNFY